MTSTAAGAPSDGVVVAVVLAAGEGSRFTASGGHKLLADLGGKPMIAWAVEAALDAGLAETVVVEGAVALAEALRGAGLLGRVTLVRNERWSEGQAVSLARGLAVAGAAGATAAVVGLGDQPLIGAEAWRRLAAAPAEPPIAVATYGGRRRNPVRLGREIWGLLPIEGDEGARVLIRGRPDLVMEVPCPGEPADIDTVEDLRRWS